MGIQGLLPYLKKASRQAHIQEFKGCTVAVDSYCWLHRGAFACAEKLAMGEKTDQYVHYCMKYVNYMLSVGVKPIMVFDGCHLPSKKEVEKTRRERRETYRKKAAQFLREGRRSEARDCLTKCIDITPQMALELMNACRKKGVDCIVAPYEADAQLAYLNKIGIAQLIISEDSDLILFGCEKVMFKMDNSGNGILVESRHLNVAMDLRPDTYTFEKFRYMCILSGCDYLPNLPGIGLGKATKVFKLSQQTDISLILKKLPSILNMAKLVVPPEYIDSFHKANNTFLYQLVFDPLKRQLMPLNPYPPEINPEDLEYAGSYMDPQKAYQIALGNVDIHTGQVIADFNPDTHKPKYESWKNLNDTLMLHQLSIWNKNYRPMSRTSQCSEPEVGQKSTKGQEVTVTLPKTIKKRVTLKRAHEDDDEGEEDLLSVYQELDVCSQPTKLKKIDDSTNVSLASKNKKLDTHCALDQSDLPKPLEQMDKSPLKSPVKNVFAVKKLTLKNDKPILNPEKKPNIVIEVKSRFFKKREPLLPTNFFDELNMSHDDTGNANSSVSDDCKVETEILRSHSLEVNSVEIPSLPSNTMDNRTGPSVKQETLSPYGSFGFSRKKSILDSYRSTFDKSCSSVKSDFKSLKPAAENRSYINCELGTESLDKTAKKPVGGSDLESASGSQESGLYGLDHSKSYDQKSADTSDKTSQEPVKSLCFSGNNNNDSPSENGKGFNGFHYRLTTGDRETSEDTPELSVINTNVPLTPLQSNPKGSQRSLSKLGVRTPGLTRCSKKCTLQTKDKEKQPAISAFFTKFAFKKR